MSHRDIKPENFLIFNDESNLPKIIKAADFGLAKKVEFGSNYMATIT